MSSMCSSLRRPLDKLCLSTMDCSKGSSETIKVEGSDGKCENITKKAKVELRARLKKVMKTMSQEGLEAGGEAVRDRVGKPRSLSVQEDAYPLWLRGTYMWMVG